MVASDGLWRYADRSAVLAAAAGANVEEAADALLELARLPSGALQDDVSLVLARP